MYEDKRPVVSLSAQCWQCFKVIQDVGYANSFIFFLSQRLEQVQRAFRTILTDIQGDLFRFHYEEKTVTFSLGDRAINHYRPIIQEFSSFGSAVKILGAYENYIRTIVEISEEVIPEEIDRFKSCQKKTIREVRDYWSHNLGRGIDLMQKLFGWEPNPAYKPSLQFIFHLRNLAVHNQSKADRRLCQLANNQYVQVNGKLHIGFDVSWSLSLNLQLQELLTHMLPEADIIIASKLGLKTIEKRAFWYRTGDDSN